uniref:Nas2 N-terminal domain-containing protein n=1 Tax=Stegastes partitus TaxID=144197 RepID=A0A3B4ZX92_9TELE
EGDEEAVLSQDCFHNSGNSEITMDDVRNLIKKKDEIEEQIKAYYDVLEDQGVGVEGPLVDAEGCPRADVNLYQIPDEPPLCHNPSK